MMITPEVLQEFKRKMKISHNDDENLTDILNRAAAYVKTKCGAFTFEKEGATELDSLAVGLVFERSRFDYNDALEYFEDAFQSEIVGLGMEYALKEGATVEKII